MQVFEVNDAEFWAGEGSALGILNAYMAETGKTHREATGDELIFPAPLQDELLDQLKVSSDDGAQQTFREHLDDLIRLGVKFPCFFASLRENNGDREHY